MGGGASKYAEPDSLDQKPQRPPPPPATEVIRPHGKKMVITKGCGCEWCEAVSWELVGELRTDIEKLQQSLMLREVDRAELEALLQIKIEVTSDLREKLRRATEDAADLHKQIAAQQQRIADLELSVELHDTPEEMTQQEVVQLLQWKATVLQALADAGNTGGVPIDDPSAITERLRNYEEVKSHCDQAEAENRDLQATVASTRLQLENANAEIARLKKLFAPKKKFNVDVSGPVPRGLPAFPAQQSHLAAPQSKQLALEGGGSPGGGGGSLATKETGGEGEGEGERRRRELEALAAEKDAAFREKDPIGWETKSRLTKRLSIDTRLAGI